MNAGNVGRLYQRAVGQGLVGSIAAIYLALIGIVERFEPREVITDVVTLGRVAPAIVILVLVYRAAAPPRAWGMEALGRAQLVTASLLAGAASGIGIGLFLIINHVVDMSGVLVSATPEMEHLVSFGLEFPVGSLAIVGVGLAIGAIAAGLHLLAPQVRRPLVGALASVPLLSLMETFMRVVLVQLGLDDVAAFFYRSGGLTPAAAALVFAVVLLVGLGNAFRGRAVRERVEALPADRRQTLQIVAFVVGLLVLLALPQLIGSFLSEVIGTVGIFILMGLGLNIVVGYAGLLDLGYVAFFAIGAYTMAILTSPVSALGLEMSFWVALPIVVLAGAFSGLLIGAPVLRLRGDYLAIVTLGMGEIVRILLLSEALSPWTGGSQGILQVPPPALLEIDFFRPQNLYYPILAFVLIGIFVARSLANSRVGRAWNAMREDEDVAAATGINIVNYKLLAFSMGAIFGAIAGTFLAVKLGSVFPHRLDVLVSITVLSVIILGGMGSIPGVIVGAFVLVGLPELLREFAEYRLLIYGAVLVGMMLWRPEGLIPSAQRRRELHDEAEEEEEGESLERPADHSAPALQG
jgi:branched-chain amino acid transport system permease protein